MGLNELLKLLLITVFILQIGLMIFALLELYKNGTQSLNKWIWLLIILFVNMAGPIAYLIFGRRDCRYIED